MASKLSALIAATTEKNAPTDADKVPLLDSATSNYFKWIGWGSLKTALQSLFATLAGKSGGQTLIGGTGVTDKLVLQGTSGNGTSTVTALEVRVGNNGSLTALTVSNSGQLAIQGDATTDLPVYGSELLSSAGWTVNAGWTESPDDVFAHSSGTATLTHSATITNGYKYQIAWTITGRTAGSITVSVGGQSYSGATATGAWGPAVTSTSALTITPTADFNGTVSLVSLKQITAVSTPYRIIKNSSSAVVFEKRANSTSVFFGVGSGGYCSKSANCIGIGVQSLQNLTTGYDNVAIGSSTQKNVITGFSNVSIGSNVHSLLTTGLANCAIGTFAQQNTTTGSNNISTGTYSLYACVSGSENAAVGSNSLFSLTTGSYNCAIGSNAGRRQADGSTALTDPEYSIYIGYNARGKDNADDNSVVIGGNSPIGLGANTTVIGTSATTLTRLFGDIGAGVDAPSAKIHAIKTTEQLRLGYDASNYASFTVSSDGTLNLTSSNNKITHGASRTPASASASGTAGEVCWDASYIYVCTAANTWKRAAIATW